MKKIIIMGLLIFFIGCSMSTEEIINRVNECEKAGMYPAIKISLLSNDIIGIQCWPMSFAKKMIKKEIMDEYVKSLKKETTYENQNTKKQ